MARSFRDADVLRGEPHEAALSDYQTLRPVAGEEDLARELVHSLDTAQRSVAIISKAAPFDIVQSNRPRVEDGAQPEWIARVFNGLPDGGTADRLTIMQNDLDSRQAMTDADREAARYSLTPKGLAAGGMSQAQVTILRRLLREYTNRLPEPLAAVEHERLLSILPELHFAWAGGIERKQPHYYRLQGPRVLIEYDCVQNNAQPQPSVLARSGGRLRARPAGGALRGSALVVIGGWWLVPTQPLQPTTDDRPQGRTR